MCQCTMAQESDINVLLEAIEVFCNDEQQQCQTLQSLASLCLQENGPKLFKKCSGIEQILQLLFTAKTIKLKGMVLYVLSNAVSDFDSSKKLLCRTELFSYLAKSLLPIRDTFLIRMVLFFIMSLCSKYAAAQNLVRTSGCLTLLVEMFRLHIPAHKTDTDRSYWFDSVGMNNENDVWLTLSATISSVVGNPQNMVNQMNCFPIIPKILALLKSEQSQSVWFSSLHCLSQCIDGNEKAKQRFSMISGHSVLVEFFNEHANKKEDLKPGTLSLTISTLLSLVEISDQIKLSVGKQGLVQTLIQITKEKENNDDNLLSLSLLCLAKSVENCEFNQRVLQENDGVTAIINCLGQSEDPSICKAGVCILENLLPGKEEKAHPVDLDTLKTVDQDALKATPNIAINADLDHEEHLNYRPISADGNLRYGNRAQDNRRVLVHSLHPVSSSVSQCEPMIDKEELQHKSSTAENLSPTSCCSSLLHSSYKPIQTNSAFTERRRVFNTTGANRRSGNCQKPSQPASTINFNKNGTFKRPQPHSCRPRRSSKKPRRTTLLAGHLGTPDARCGLETGSVYDRSSPPTRSCDIRRCRPDKLPPRHACRQSVNRCEVPRSTGNQMEYRYSQSLAPSYQNSHSYIQRLNCNDSHDPNREPYSDNSMPAPKSCQLDRRTAYRRHHEASFKKVNGWKQNAYFSRDMMSYHVQSSSIESGRVRKRGLKRVEDDSDSDEMEIHDEYTDERGPRIHYSPSALSYPSSTLTNSVSSNQHSSELQTPTKKQKLRGKKRKASFRNENDRPSKKHGLCNELNSTCSSESDPEYFTPEQKSNSTHLQDAGFKASEKIDTEAVQRDDKHPVLKETLQPMTPPKREGILGSIKNMFWTVVQATPFFKRKRSQVEGKCLGCYPFSRFPFFVLNARNSDSTLKNDKFTCPFHKSFQTKLPEMNSVIELPENTSHSRKSQSDSGVCSTTETVQKSNKHADTRLKKQDVAKSIVLAEDSRTSSVGCLSTSQKQSVTNTALKKRKGNNKYFLRPKKVTNTKMSSEAVYGPFAFNDELESSPSDASLMAFNHPRKHQNRRHRKDYTKEEIISIVEGVKRYGKRWTSILHSYEFANGRTAEDLKDKYRQLKKKNRTNISDV